MCGDGIAGGMLHGVRAADLAGGVLVLDRPDVGRLAAAIAVTCTVCWPYYYRVAEGHSAEDLTYAYVQAPAAPIRAGTGPATCIQATDRVHDHTLTLLASR